MSQRTKIILWCIAGAVVLVVMVWVVIPRIDLLIAQTTNPTRPPSTVVLLGIAFAVGAIVLFGTLMVFALLSGWVDKGTDRNDVRGALSLPHGSISAVLALSILVVFSVTSIHIFSEIRAGEGSGLVSRGITQEALALLPGDRVLHIQAEQATVGQAPTYTVNLSNPHENSTNFAGELMTIFSTLLIAIVGFYFGQGATAAGMREGREIDQKKPLKPEAK